MVGCCADVFCAWAVAGREQMPRSAGRSAYRGMKPGRSCNDLGNNLSNDLSIAITSMEIFNIGSWYKARAAAGISVRLGNRMSESCSVRIRADSVDRTFSPRSSHLASDTQPVGLGWDSGAPLALGRPGFSSNSGFFSLALSFMQLPYAVRLCADFGARVDENGTFGGKFNFSESHRLNRY